MPLVNRLSRLFRADMHAVLDSIEEPALLLRQAIRDMEDELRGSESELAERSAEQEALARRMTELAGATKQAQSELDLCLDAGNEKLARHLLRRKLESERLINHLERREGENGDWIESAKRQLEEQRLTLEGLRQKSDLLGEHAGSAARSDFDESCWKGRDLQVTDDDVEIALLRELERRTAV